jgi:hypothetical protein
VECQNFDRTNSNEYESRIATLDCYGNDAHWKGRSKDQNFSRTGDEFLPIRTAVKSDDEIDSNIYVRYIAY